MYPRKRRDVARETGAAGWNDWGKAGVSFGVPRLRRWKCSCNHARGQVQLSSLWGGPIYGAGCGMGCRLGRSRVKCPLFFSYTWRQRRLMESLNLLKGHVWDVDRMMERARSSEPPSTQQGAPGRPAFTTAPVPQWYIDSASLSYRNRYYTRFTSSFRVQA